MADVCGAVKFTKGINKMNTEEFKKLLEDRAYKYSGYIDQSLYGQGFADCQELLWPLVESINNHHKNWSENDDCLSECSLTCKALKDLEQTILRHNSILPNI